MYTNVRIQGPWLVNKCMDRDELIFELTLLKHHMFGEVQPDIPAHTEVEETEQGKLETQSIEKDDH